ncbi:MAG: rRNA maturation RNase YbeY [Oxalobacter formigenes]|nr:rRNA maturation RNase YbeY [Oxalobacter formigenes]MCM1281498.1 rRNA maturation RNase YbeY [Alistipes senegalensis]MCM1513043.1 rRNA maturation RNase YbeY [Oxalobacter formigenes]
MKPDFPLSLSIQYADLRLQNAASRPQIRRWVRAALQQPAAIALRFVGEAEGRALNRDFRKKDYATNVLTFAYGNTSPDPESEAAAEADIILCADVILAEAKAQGKTPAAHLAHLIIHGVLHAQGYDHETENEAAEMEALETRILARFRIADPYA